MRKCDKPQTEYIIAENAKIKLEFFFLELFPSLFLPFFLFALTKKQRISAVNSLFCIFCT